MHNFEYASPKTLSEALPLLAAEWGVADVLAGGTDLISLMKEDNHAPKRVVNIKDIAELHGISQTPHGVRIGATTAVDELLNSALIRTSYPALHEAALGITSPQIRNMGTVGGDLCQRPRCWFFRGGHGILAMHEGKSMVPDSDNRYHAIFPSGNAYFVSASSFGPALIALGAKLKVASAKGERDIAAADFFVAPSDEKAREIALQPNEILTAILLPPAVGVKNATYEVRHRDAIDWPLATASVTLKMKGTSVASASIVLGHVGPTPYVAADAAKGIAGKTVTPETAEEAAKAAVADAKPLSMNAYKVTLARVAVKRALLAAAGVHEKTA